jgi:DtxR family Mn-dependent transcriptional regulator
MTTPLNMLNPGQKGRIVKIRAKGEMNKRILEMGVIPGSLIQLERVAPLGDPIQFKIKGYHLTLRKEEAQEIEVAPMFAPETAAKL